MTNLLWIAYCKECGDIRHSFNKIPNGNFVNALAKLHKQENPEHTVYLCTEVE